MSNYIKASQSAYNAIKKTGSSPAAKNAMNRANKYFNADLSMDDDQEELEFTVRGGPERWTIATKDYPKKGIKKGDRYLTKSQTFKTNKYSTSYARESKISPTTGQMMCRRTAYAQNQYNPYKDDGTTPNMVPRYRNSVPYDSNNPSHRNAPLYKNSSSTKGSSSATRRTGYSSSSDSRRTKSGALDGRSKPGGNNPNGRNGSSSSGPRSKPSIDGRSKPGGNNPNGRNGSSSSDIRRNKASTNKTKTARSKASSSSSSRNRDSTSNNRTRKSGPRSKLSMDGRSKPGGNNPDGINQYSSSDGRRSGSSSSTRKNNTSSYGKNNTSSYGRTKSGAIDKRFK